VGKKLRFRARGRGICTRTNGREFVQIWEDGKLILEQFVIQ
jgi:hypothetical protein